MTVDGAAAVNGHGPGTRSRSRRDHERNRHRIIDAARDLFSASESTDVQLRDVAQAAGVSQATLFRHIGSKHALVTMAYQDRITDIVGLADDALAAEDPWTGVSRLLRTLAGWFHDDRALWQFAAGEHAGGVPMHAVMLERFGEVLDRARADGSLRAGIGADDVIPLLGARARPDGDRWTVYTDVLLGGLRTPAP